MVQLNAGTALRHIRNLLAKHGSFPDGDRQLLQRFTATADEAAFAALLRRHGPMVLRICREVLHEEHAAEDAFQATFLVLAEKAASIREHESVGGWLRCVAQRVALRARTRAGRFPVCVPVPEAGVTNDPLAEMTVREARVLLHEELQRLPAKYREPLCLCYLEGKTRDEAAQLLQWPLGTFSSRLDRARELLRARLTRRGVTLSGVLLASVLSGNSAAALSKTLADVTVQAALRLATGQAITGIASAEAVAMAQGLMPIAMSKPKLLVALVLVLGLLGTAFGVVAARVATADKEVDNSAQDQRLAAAAPAPQGDRYGDPLPENAVARMGTIRGRQAGIFYVACLPDNQRVITAGGDGSFRLWETKTGKELRRFSEPVPVIANDNAPFSVAVSPDGKRLAVARSFGVTAGQMMMAGPRPDDAKAPQPEKEPIRIWDVDSGKELSPAIKCTEPAKITALVFSPDSKMLAVAQGTGIVQLYDVATGRECARMGRRVEKQKLNGMEIAPPCDLSVAFTGDGNTLLLGEFVFGETERSYTARLWDAKTGKVIRQLKLPRELASMSRVLLSPDGKTLAWSDYAGSIVLWDAEQEKERRRLNVKDGSTALCLTFSGDSKQLAATYFDGRIRLWDVATGKEEAKLGDERLARALRDVITAQLGGVTRHVDLAFSADGKTLVSAGKDGTIRVWDLATSKEHNPAGGHQGAVTTVALSTDGTVLSTGGGDGTVRQWDTATGRQLREFPRMASTVALHMQFRNVKGSFSSDGRRFAFAGPPRQARQSGVNIYVWDVAADKELWKIESPVRTMTDLAFSPDNKVLATLGSGDVIQLWDAESGTALRSMQKDNRQVTALGLTIQPDTVGLLFSPDGTILASVENKTTPDVDPAICLWNPATGKVIRKLDLDGPMPGADLSSVIIAFSPDSRMLAGAHSDGRLYVWELATGKQRFVLTEGIISPTALAWSRDGKTLALGSADRTVRLRDVISGTEVGQFSGHGGSVGALAFAADSRTLYSTSDDTTALAWRLSELKKAEAPAATNPNDKDLEALWSELRADDAARGWKAIDALSRARPALVLLRDRLRPVAAADTERLAELISALESARFEERRRAAEQLEVLGDLAVPALRKALDDQPSLETRKRVETILGNILNKQLLSPQQLQALRALEVLERIGTVQAAQILEVLSKGAPAARLTREAQASVDRLTRTPGQ